jgi:hypothetical protein
MLLVVLMSVTDKIQASQGTCFVKRPQANILRVPIERLDYGVGAFIFSEKISDKDMEYIFALFDRSFLLLPQRSSFLKRAVREFNVGVTDRYNGYHRACCILLPQLEHSLRRVSKLSYSLAIL